MSKKQTKDAFDFAFKNDISLGNYTKLDNLMIYCRKEICWVSQNNGEIQWENPGHHWEIDDWTETTRIGPTEVTESICSNN